MDFEDYLWNDPYARCVARHDDASVHKLHDSYLAVADQYYGLYRHVIFVGLPEAMSDPAYQDDPDIGDPTGGAHLELMMRSRKLEFPPNTKPYKELDGMCRG